MLRAFKFQIYPNKKQKSIIDRTLGTSRFIWNLALEECKKSYETEKKFKHRSLKSYKEEFPWMKETCEQAKQNALRHLDQALRNTFSKSRKKKCGFPKFKSKRGKQSYSVCSTSYLKDGRSSSARVDEKGKVHLLCLGDVKYRTGYEFETLNELVVRTFTITRTCIGKYFCSLFADAKMAEAPQTNSVIGIDLGLKSFAVFSDGTKVDKPNEEKINKRIKFLQKTHSRTKNGGKNREKARIKLAKKYARRSSRRMDFLHKLSSRIVNENQVICLEDLNVKGMIKNHKLARSISDASWSEFVRMLEYKSGWKRRELVKIDRFFASSKTCHECGHKHKHLTLDEREWVCRSCGAVLDRDVNAAMNIRDEGMRILEENSRAERDSLCKLREKVNGVCRVGLPPNEQECFIGETL